MDVNLPLMLLIAGMTGAIDPQFAAETTGQRSQKFAPPDEDRLLPPREQHRWANWLVDKKIQQSLSC